jgi:hypothetical protein
MKQMMQSALAITLYITGAFVLADALIRLAAWFSKPYRIEIPRNR